MKNKVSDVDIDFDKTIGEGGERISVSDFFIKGDAEMVFVSVCKSDKEVNLFSWGSGKATVGQLQSNKGWDVRGDLSNHFSL